MISFPGIACALRACALAAAVATAAASHAQSVSLPAPQPAGYDEILNNSDREVATFRFARHNRVFILDFPSLAKQGATFNRASAFIERQLAPHDRVLSDAEMAGYLQALHKTPETLSYGNNFSGANLVLFFNVAEDKDVALNSSERALLDLLLAQRVLFKRTGFYQASDPGSVVLSIPQVGAAPSSTQAVTAQIRSSILRHELSHAEYYVNGRYAEFCRSFWGEALSDAQRNAFREFLARSTYDTALEEVVINEWQAYLVHTPDKAAFRGEMVGMSDEELDRMRENFRKQSAANGVVLSLF